MSPSLGVAVADSPQKRIVVQRVPYLGGWGRANEASYASIDVIVAHKNSAVCLEARSVTARRSLRQGPKQRHRLLNEVLHVSMKTDLMAKRRLESFRDVYHRQSSSNRIWVVSMDELAKRIEVTLAVAACPPVFRHHRLGLDGYANLTLYTSLPAAACSAILGHIANRSSSTNSHKIFP